MSGFWEGFLWGLAVIGMGVAIVLPLALTALSPAWLLLYLIELPIVMGIIGWLA